MKFRHPTPFMKYIIFSLLAIFFIGCTQSTKKPIIVSKEPLKKRSTDKIQLIDEKPFICSGYGAAYDEKQTLNFEWQNDSILFINTTITANGGLICTPHIHIYGSLIDLHYDFDNPKKNNDYDKCISYYTIKWHLKGIKKSDKYVYLFQGCITNNFDKKLASSLFKRINRLKDSNRVVSVLDNFNRKQGLYINQVGKQELMYYYKDDVLVDSIVVSQ